MSFVSSDSLVEFTNKYHLLPFVFLFLFVGLASTLAMAVKSCFRFLGEMVDAYYDFKQQVASSKERYERGLSKQ